MQSRFTMQVAGALWLVTSTVFAAPGNLDTSFAGTGKARLGFGHGADAGKAIAVQSDGKIVMAGSGESDFTVVRYNPDGSLDASFGGKGIVSTNFGTYKSTATALKIQPADGKIVVAGYVTPPIGLVRGSFFAVARYNIDGSLDNTFDGNGRAMTFIQFESLAKANAVALQSDGKIVLAGDNLNTQTSKYDFAVVRYNADGSLDTSFSGDGKLTTPIGTGNDSANGVAILGTTIVVAGSSRSGANQSIAVVRYTSDGTLDASFDGDGIVTTAVTAECVANAVAIEFGSGVTNPNKILVAGYAKDNSYLIALLRYNVNGSLDTSFGTNGIVRTAVADSDVGVSLIVDASTRTTKYLVGFNSRSGGNSEVGLVRYNASGSFDTSFNLGGRTSIIIGGSVTSAAAIARQGDGKIVIGGTSFKNGESDFLAIRFSADGLVDQGFHSVGYRIDDVSDLPVTARGVAVQSDGKIVLAGSTQQIVNGQRDNYAAVIRCLPDGSLDTTFDVDGLVTVGGVLEPSAVAVQQDGRIVVAGYSSSPSPNGLGRMFQFALLRFNTNGSLDSSFDGDGLVTTTVGSQYDQPAALVIQPDGKIVAVGTGDDGFNNTSIVIARYNPNGSLDITFNGSGTVATRTNTKERINAVALQPDGKIVVAGGSREVVGGLVARYNANGSADNSFDFDGFLTPQIGPFYAVAVQPDGKIVLAGQSTSFNGTASHFQVARFNSSGGVDTSFNNGLGKAVTAVGSSDSARAITLDASGKITAAGWAKTGNVADNIYGEDAFPDDDFAAVRYKADGSLDTSFGNGGIFITELSVDATDTGYALASDATGRSLIAGESDGLVGVVRLLGDPVPVPTPTPSPTPTPTKTLLGNISTRLRVETGDNVLFGGFIITGTQPKRLIIRAIGPTVPVLGNLQNPNLELYSGSTRIAANDNWVDATNKQEISDSGIAPKSDLESAILTSLAPGAYSAIVRGVNGTTGVGLIEVYDLAQSSDSKLAQISTRGFVQTGDNVMFGGFFVLNGSQKVIIRAIGPSTGLTGALQDPTLELYDGNGTQLTSNDNWVDAPNKQEIIDSTVAPKSDFESAILRTLTPGPYTAIVRGKNDTTGIALVEVYALN